MGVRQELSRRGFVGGVAAALGSLGLGSGATAWAERALRNGLAPAGPGGREPRQDPYDSFAKLAFNENPYGPSDAVLEAMTHGFRYANRYAYPDGGIEDAIAEHHGVGRAHILMGAGSGEILEVVGLTFLQGGRKVVGTEPSYTQVYRHATSIRADAILVPLLEDYRQDIPALIRAVRANHRDVGFVYLCNPNNPTGRVVTAQEVRALLDGIPADVPVLIDEAYHHYVEDPAYATSVPYALEGRPVIVARTFSKIHGLAGMRLGYGIAPPELVRRMRPYATGTINASVKWGGAAALRDVEAQERVRRLTLELRRQTTSGLEALGYRVIPSEASFFMVDVRRPVQPVIEEFRKRGVLVGRPFPPLLQHLRVSIGTADEMRRFMDAFREIFNPVETASG